ncbi:hypothetical protein BU24DRAFT_466419 [Aaosphaeria arxii CBS 175.79]|uniref:Uncharacterized protein n=1 Tax=Aaosphaeria arxii CBS 175.79 TaxID=1450172 RepID=A0A6A5XFN1_9PLEO|nr:uncharacterized protein BU24DRAFT_466419 [Aaosphaeria arxii CBS 175.79]KAF2011740.1 hypothetical protein BU24DRAFT_466419 [Aaosphaeria arxii CBS 175.79]
MKFTAIIAAVVSMAAFAIAAPVPAVDEVAARQDHGMCVKGVAGQITQIPNC